MYNFSTEAWDCGPDVCNVELDTKNKEITDKEMTAIEDECNKKIVKGVEVHAAWYKPDDPELKKAHTRGLPKDHEGLVRMVTIDGIDDNLCCGTHVRNLHELQVLKLLKTTKAPKGKDINIFFSYLCSSCGLYHTYSNSEIFTFTKSSVGPIELCFVVLRWIIDFQNQLYLQST